MDALILAAGRGTRLGALGAETPKALIEIGGRTMLERVAAALVAAGADRLIVNISHHAGRIARFVAAHDLGAEVVLSREEPEPLETGGALVHARPLFRTHAPIVLHNVDIITTADIAAMVAAHEAGEQALATLAVHERRTARHLLFDENGLYGRTDTRTGVAAESRKPSGRTRPLAFAGIHVISPRLLDRITERGVFSILNPYLRLAGAGERIVPFAIDEAVWLEIGTPERLEAARLAVARGDLD
ncbi:MAG: NTP transferase domain-containing protein [Gemmatimonadetes bacterium]|nr:NTP transferase domain-containing protein [Gemmatimonadota bacterium]